MTTNTHTRTKHFSENENISEHGSQVKRAAESRDMYAKREMKAMDKGTKLVWGGNKLTFDGNLR